MTDNEKAVDPSEVNVQVGSATSANVKTWFVVAESSTLAVRGQYLAQDPDKERMVNIADILNVPVYEVLETDFGHSKSRRVVDEVFTPEEADGDLSSDDDQTDEDFEAETDMIANCIGSVTLEYAAEAVDNLNRNLGGWLDDPELPAEALDAVSTPIFLFQLHVVDSGVFHVTMFDVCLWDNENDDRRILVDDYFEGESLYESLERTLMRAAEPVIKQVTALCNTFDTTFDDTMEEFEIEVEDSDDAEESDE